MRIRYEEWSPGVSARLDIDRALEICATYAEDGYDLTLRQLYYQFVARGFIPNNNRSYKRLGSIINRARMAGLLDWDYIVDRTRSMRKLPHWASAGNLIRDAAAGFGQDLWSDQPTRVEIWVEKEALASVVQRVASRWDCPWFSCRGYVSQSEQWAASRRISRYIAQGQRCLILHLGDHDPSGIDMTRDINDRLSHFITTDYLNDNGIVPEWDDDRGMRELLVAQDFHFEPGEHSEFPLEVRRIALNMDQIDRYAPPPNPTKLTDSRAGGYIDLYGRQSWELDALDPRTLEALVEQHIVETIDMPLYEERHAAQEEIRSGLTLLSQHSWDDIKQWLEGSTE